MIYNALVFYPKHLSIFPLKLKEKYFELSVKTLEIIQNRGSNIATTMTNKIIIPFCHASHYSIYTPWVRKGLQTLTLYPNYLKVKKTNQCLGQIF